MDRDNNEILISDIVKMFCGKGKIVLCTVIAFAVMGLAYALIAATVLGDYGNTVSFRLSATDCTDELLPMLNSERFAEKLLLDENGLPSKELCDDTLYAKAQEAMTAYRQGVETVKKAKSESELYHYNITLPDGSTTTWDGINATYERLQNDCDDIVNLLDIYKSANADAVAQDPNHPIKTAEYEAMLATALEKKEAFERDVYLVAIEEKERLEQQLSQENFKLRALRKNVAYYTEQLLDPWRNNKNVKEKIRRITKALSFECEKTDADSEDKSVKVTAFITADVSVHKDKAFANSLIMSLKLRLPTAVCDTIDQLESSVDSDCTVITPFVEAKNLEADGLVKKMGTKAVLFAVIGFALCCTVIVCRGYMAAITSDRNK